MQVAIISGGLATRLRPLTLKVPKSMVDITGKPFLECQLRLLKKNNVTDVVLCVGYLFQPIQDYFGDGWKFGVRIRYAIEGERLLGTGGALKNAEELLEDKFLVMWGDSYLPIDYGHAWSYFEKHDKPSMLVVYRNYGRYDRSNVAVKNERVIKYEKNSKDRSLTYIDAGVSILRKEVLKIIPPNSPSALETAYTELARNGKMLKYETSQRFYEIGSKEGLDEFKKAAPELCHDLFYP